MIGQLAAAATLVLVACYLILSAALGYITTGRARAPLSWGESVTLALVRLGLALATLGIAVWVMTS